MDLEGENSMEMGHDEDIKMEMELDAAHALANLADSDPISNQLSTSQAEGPQQFQPEVRENSKEGKGNRRQNQTPYKAGSSNSNNQANVSSMRGRKHLNEADRDAKRLRRILANRESARQTILRRQAFRDELARKIAVLSAENLALKQEKENATREYFSQKEMNEQLKEQMMQIAPLKEENELQPTVSEPASQMPVNPSIPARAVSEELPAVNTETTAEVSCSLTLGVGKTKEETTVEKHEAVICKPKSKRLQSDTEWKEGSYYLLDAPNARRRRMEISRLKQSNRD